MLKPHDNAEAHAAFKRRWAKLTDEEKRKSLIDSGIEPQSQESKAGLIIVGFVVFVLMLLSSCICIHPSSGLAVGCLAPATSCVCAEDAPPEEPPTYHNEDPNGAIESRLDY